MAVLHVLRRGLTPLTVLLLTLMLPVTAAGQQVRILQTNAFGDRVHIIDPVTNTVVGEIPGIEVAHGVTVSPDGNRIFVSSEADFTLDVVDVKALKVIKKIPLSGEPNNIAITPDGRKVYVGIRAGTVGNNPGVADVIDTATLTKVKSVRTEGPVHNLYVTHDGKFMFAGDGSRTAYVSVIDAQTDLPVWSVQFSCGGSIKPMTSDNNPDGSTRNLYVQCGEKNGFFVVDFKARKITHDIDYPKLASIPPNTGGSSAAHGLAVTADQKTLVACSRLNNSLYSYSLPDLKLAGTANLSGGGCAWVTLTPDGKRAYVADSVGNQTLVVDIPTMKEVAKIKVGEGPKRNHTMVIPAGGRATGQN